MVLTFENFLIKLARGQLKNTAASDDSESGIIQPQYYDQLLELTNQGLIDITSRKKLYENTVALTFIMGQNLYPLDTSAGAEYENFVRVIEIVTSDERKHTPKTNAHITQPNPEALRFSSKFMDLYKPAVDIRFQTTHPVITIDGEMNLPTHLYEALVLYVSGLYLTHMGGEEHKKTGDSYYGLYLKMMTDDTINNFSGTSEVTDEDTRFYDRGFV